jgi:pimeloyl-ACP methyl ester carboxylesterase
MDTHSPTLVDSSAGILAAVAAVTPMLAPGPITIERRFAEVSGIKLHYLTAGKGDPVLLLHGYAQTSHMWRPLIAELAKTHTVIAPDLRGFGESAGRRLRQEDDGAGRPCPRGVARAQARRCRGS